MKNATFTFLYFSLVLSLSFGVQKVCAATFNVSNTTALKNALRDARAGDLILLAPGTYSTNATTASFPTADGSTVSRSYYFRGAANGTASKKITIRSQSSSNKAIISGSNINNAGYGLYITGDYWVIQNIKITNAAKGLVLDNSNYSIIRGVEVYNIGQEGIHLRDGSRNTLVDNVYVHDVGKYNDGYGEGIYVGSDNSVWWEGDGTNTGENGRYYRRAVNNTRIKNSTFGPNITAEPVEIKEGTVNTIVENCIIRGSGISSVNFADSNMDIKGTHAKIRCNTFYQDGNTTIEQAIMIVPRQNAGVPQQYTAHHNYIHDNTFYMSENAVEILVANNGSQNNHGWNNTRQPSSGNYYNSRITQSRPSGYSNSCGGSLLPTPSTVTYDDVNEDINTNLNNVLNIPHINPDAITNNQELSVYPNPTTSSMVNLSLKGFQADERLEVSVFDMFGKKIMASQNTSTGVEYSIGISLPVELPNSTYLIVVQAEETLLKQLFVLKR